MAKVRVYKFRRYEIVKDELVTSKRYATEDRIEEICAEKIEGSGIDIDDGLLESGMTEIGFQPQ